MMSVANMAKNNNKLGAAFKYHEIFDRISHRSTNFIEWYLVTGMVFRNNLNYNRDGCNKYF